jgi:outer membrane biosynthesis protein TonB
VCAQRRCEKGTTIIRRKEFEKFLGDSKPKSDKKDKKEENKEENKEEENKEEKKEENKEEENKEEENKEEKKEENKEEENKEEENKEEKKPARGKARRSFYQDEGHYDPSSHEPLGSDERHGRKVKAGTSYTSNYNANEVILSAYARRSSTSKKKKSSTLLNKTARLSTSGPT